MSAPAAPAPPAPGDTPPTPPPSGRAPGRPRWMSVLPPLASGLAVLLAGSATGVVVQGSGWIVHGAVAVALVVVVGALLPLRAWAVAPGQLVALALLVTGWFTTSGVAAVLPGPAALRELAALLGGAGTQIDTGLPPVPETPEILLLVTLGFGTLAIAVFGLAVTVGAPAAGGVPLLAMIAVPTALDPDLLPWWAIVAATAGFGLLLLLRPDTLRQAPGGAAVVAVAVVGALLIGSSATAVGTAGRFEAGSGSGGQNADGSIGLNPFTSLRGQLTRSEPRDLFRVHGLTTPTYLRALTLENYVPQEGWKASRPLPGVPLAGPLPPSTSGPAGQQTVQVENLGFTDFWLPVFGDPVSITGPSETDWSYDASGAIAYSERPREEDGWTEAMRVPAPSADQLRTASGPTTVDRGYTSTAGIDPRVTAIAQQVTRDARTPFDKAMALQDYFTGPGSPFTYNLSTAPGGNGDALADFLTRGRTGYCEQFASAMAVMLRASGVPARVAVGFTAGNDGPDGRTITTNDAHAWVEAWFPGYGWQTFDPTPLQDGRTIEPNYVQQAHEQEGGDPAQAQPPADAPPPPPPPDAGADGASSPPPPEPEQAPADAAPQDAGDQGSSWWPAVVAVAGALVLAGLALLAPGFVRRRRYAARIAAARAGGPGAAAAAWDEVRDSATDAGHPVPAGDTVRGAAGRITEDAGLTGRPADVLQELSGRVEASWYGGMQPPEGVLDGPVDEVRAALADAGGTSWKQRLLPASVLAGLPGITGVRTRLPGLARLTGRFGRRGPGASAGHTETPSPDDETVGAGR
ncbi:transglutaminase family protein [Pseudonocardia phyllosphaerae]|uniref:transglutaminase family protein n=1 Tax=Pseudonocardia phyllosphaerae TaxID=3390502 RepID=UPI00397A7D59